MGPKGPGGRRMNEKPRRERKAKWKNLRIRGRVRDGSLTKRKAKAELKAEHESRGLPIEMLHQTRTWKWLTKK